MNYKIILIIISFFHVSTSFGQIVILDSISSNPLPAVSVFNSAGKLLCISDNNGKVRLDIENIASQDNLTFQHVSYNSKEIGLTKLFSSEGVIKLSPMTILIEEIKINNKIKDWLMLRGYYRVLETFDGKNKYFTDGIVQFYIPFTG